MILMRVDELIIASGIQPSGNIYSASRLASISAVAFTSGVAIILMVAVSKTIGVLLLGFTALFFILIPIVYIALKARVPASFGTVSSNQIHRTADIILMPQIETLVTSAATHRKLVLTLATILTAISVFFALKLEPIFDVKDFFDSNSEMVIGLDLSLIHI